jgi:hypothetical protein
MEVKMIIKIMNENKDGYSYYEADEITYRLMNMKDAKNLKYDNVEWLINDQDKEKNELKVIVMWLYKDECSTIRLLYIVRESYIMNNNGKTIDRLL